MAFVLDASVAVSWFFPDEEQAEASEARRRASEGMLVPLHWWFEVRNGLLFGERRGRISEELTLVALDRLSRLPINAAPRPQEANVFALARRHGLTFYDAAYLELAKRERIPLATLDDGLADAARAEQVALIEANR
jgi:predicted nucleic acid-binding protein